MPLEGPSGKKLVRPGHHRLLTGVLLVDQWDLLGIMEVSVFRS